MRIVSDGIGKNTRVFTDGGEEISNKVKSVEISIDANGAVSATVTFIGVRFDFKSDYAKAVFKDTFSSLLRRVLAHVR